MCGNGRGRKVLGNALTYMRYTSGIVADVQADMYLPKYHEDVHKPQIQVLHCMWHVDKMKLVLRKS
jgi:hypothetical protein